MKTPILILCLLFAFYMNLNAQKKGEVSRYEVFIYCNAEETDRGTYMGAALTGVQEIAGGYVTSVIDLGMNAIVSLLTKNTENKLKWEKIVKTENVYQDTLTTVEPINDFYKETSWQDLWILPR